ncbi:P-loop NTPase fold protein [Mucilaginibacter sp.]|uniref:P-loop NTPase fold protein n=1 Tax=Mucilaginibacter sp. TaxID=1882438 RepID=UPI003266589B
MKSNPLTFIDQQSVKVDFKKHLDDEDNQRILFSARFGAGKSTFLKNYFENSQDYISLKLYPVNYSIANNKDVFELIKYDLIYELLSNHPDDVQLEKDDYSFSLLAQIFILHNLKVDPLLKAILKASSPESEAYADIMEQLNGIVKQYSTYKKDVTNDEFSLLNKYIAQLKSFRGTAHEHDQISELITAMLQRVKSVNIENNPGIKTVLIIDDIDRLDPEHVFRLFNIFSAHYDSITEENKFGFDRVIFVCDYNNIRLMYEHRYGKGVDFSGYIDKFYSTDVFYYDNRKYITRNFCQKATKYRC